MLKMGQLPGDTHFDKNIKKVKNHDFSSSIISTRNAQYLQIDCHIVAEKILYKMMVSDHKLSSYNKRYRSCKMANFGFLGRTT